MKASNKKICNCSKFKIFPTNSCHLSTTKGTFPFSRVLLDWLVINDQKLPNWVWPTLYISSLAAVTVSPRPCFHPKISCHYCKSWFVWKCPLLQPAPHVTSMFPCVTELVHYGRTTPAPGPVKEDHWHVIKFYNDTANDPKQNKPNLGMWLKLWDQL
jgi:hypothetical protein